jgi:predicted flap endonuclease-1-like 5' DNA nuclease
MSPGVKVNLLDLAEETNGKRFRMVEIDGSTEEPGFLLQADEEGTLRLRLVFDDSEDPTYPGGAYEGQVKLGKASVYFSWTVEVKEDKRMMNKIRKEQEEAEKAEKDAKVAEEKAAKEAKAAEEKAAKEAKAAEEKAAKEAKAAEEKAAKEAKAAEEKAGKEAKADEEKAAKAATAAAAKKAKEESDAKAAKEAKAAEEKAAKEAKAAASEKKKSAKSVKEVQKQEELKRVKERAKTIDFKVIGEATTTELKSEVKKDAKTLEVGNASEFDESGSAAITDSEGSSVISWTGKDGNVLTGVSGVTRVFGKASVVMVKDDLQVIKGIGPFIEQKLNALGITTYRQLANMNAKLETEVNEAIEFFPGRVKRDQWVAQAKILLGEDVKLDEKALQQAEELERIAQKAEGIDFDILGVAKSSDRDDLQVIKGIGPFIAEKLYALGIYTFSQVSKMTPEIEEQVNVAIEFFPGRVKRDEWAKQAKELAKD